jgi:transmembrane sensor
MSKATHRWRAAWVDRQAAKWAMRIDEDRDTYEAELRRWIGQDELRADAYNRAYGALRSSGSPARAIYGNAAQRGTTVRTVDHCAARRKLVIVSAFSLVLASAAIFIMLTRLAAFAPKAGGDRSLEQDYTTRIGEVRPVRLADGSQLLLDTDTEVRATMSGSARSIVMVHGRARFDVAHDPRRPFYVVAGDATITDRGTIFDVESYTYVRVRLIAGSIDVAFRKAGLTVAAPPIHLRAGQQIRFDPTLTGSPMTPTVTPASDVQWVTGLKTFDDVPVSQILDEVNRYTTTHIVLADPSLGSHRVFLDLDLRDTSAVAQNLALYLKLDVDASKPDQLILRAPVQPS